MNNHALRIAFAGTPHFAARILQHLIADNWTIIAAYTQPDKLAGRGKKLTMSPVKNIAISHDIPVYQPSSLHSIEAQAELQYLKPDILVVAAYGLILPPAVLTIPRYGCINIHASLLPRWRGAAPIQRAILANDHETGVTIMQVDAGLDTGAMLLKKTCLISADETAGTLHDKLIELSHPALKEVLFNLEKKLENAQAQNNDLATYAKKIEKEEALIDWQQSAGVIACRIRAFNPYPVAFTFFNGQRMKIWRAEHLTEATTASPGSIISVSEEGIKVATGEGVLLLKIIQFPGGKSMPVADVLKSKKNWFRSNMKMTNHHE